ncbi:MAG: N-acetylmuramoyl-L-alanine amidase [Chloroflexota bacterium]|nr:N-acetylmuramoyl-L-alanine amidase [Chloroflexota bacterium]MDQ5867624.1 N-acetylmuramoyl-L-alanine amidase [Chloroflexota bacterium]
MPTPVRRSILAALSLLLFSAFSFLSYPVAAMAVDAESARSLAAEAFQRASTTARSSMGTLSPVALASTPVPTPVARTSTYRVAIQVGHWKNDELPEQLSSLEGNTGATGGGRREVDINFDVANRIAKLLRDAGVTVEVLPATVPTGYTADAFVAIHADGNSSVSARGFKISTRWRSEVAAQDAMLVDLLTDEYRAATGLPEDAGVTRNMRGYYAYAPFRPNWRVSNYTPGAIVEMGFITNAADREVMFNRTDNVASGIARGILRYLKLAYPNPAGARTYGYGLVDGDIDPDAPWLRRPNQGQGQQGPPPPQTIQQGDWQAYVFGKSTVNVYGGPGGTGGIIARIPKGRPYHATARKGDYYQVVLPGGKSGWVHRNSLVIQM